MENDRPDYAPPRKRSITIAGHLTSISLEPAFWAALEAAARAERLPVNALVARIDAARLSAARVPNLTSALRQFLFARALDGGPVSSDLERLGEAGAAVGGEVEP